MNKISLFAEIIICCLKRFSHSKENNMRLPFFKLKVSLFFLINALICNIVLAQNNNKGEYPLRTMPPKRDVSQIPKGIIEGNHEKFSQRFTEQTQESEKTSSESPFSIGEWYKIAVLNDGIYKIDASFLSKMGIDHAKIDPRMIRIFGKGGGMLPQANSDFRYENTPEVAIYVQGEGDGKFDNDDYIEFYAEGPHKIKYSPYQRALTQENHLYCDTTYYYINFNISAGKRVQESKVYKEGKILQTTPQLAYINKDLYNLRGMGRMWFGDKFDYETKYSYSFDLKNVLPGSQIRVYYRTAARSGQDSYMDVQLNGQDFDKVRYNAVDYDCGYCTYSSIKTQTKMFTDEQLDNGIANISFSYQKKGTGSAWMDFINLTYTQELKISGDTYTFYTFEDSTIHSFTPEIQDWKEGYSIWNVTEPVNTQKMQLQVDNNVVRFNTDSTFGKYIAFHHGSGIQPVFVNKAPNIDLRSIGPFDYLIVTHPDFISEANRLANLHRTKIRNKDGTARRVQIVTPDEIYQEFSSGMADVSSIRDFIKYHFDKNISHPQDQPKHVLLLGDGSYDAKGIQTVKSKILTYQSRESMYSPEAYTSDDFYGLMGENEGFWGEKVDLFEDDRELQVNTIDVPIGRMPAATLEEAKILVDKVINYVTNPALFGSWTQSILLVGDYKRGECNHMGESNKLGNLVSGCSPCVNIDKLFFDSYPAKSLAEGLRFPDAKVALMDKLNKGQLLVNYTGHGGEQGLSNSYIFELSDILSLENYPRLPFWITATCEFGKYDDPERVSGAEQLVLTPKGGSIGIMTSVREVFSEGNEALNTSFYKYLFCENKNYTVGEIFKAAKNENFPYWSYNINTRNFALLCDPGIYLIQPDYQAVITEINNEPLNPDKPDTIKALEKVNIKGEIKDQNNRLQSDFNGEIEIIVFDKPQKMTTLECRMKYDFQKNKIFNGRASVKNGQFEAEFIVPLDISYEIGQGKFSLYAQSNTKTAGGCNKEITVCCTSPNVSDCIEKPSIDVYIDAPNWKSGAITGPSPKIYAKIEDQLGINTTSLGVGRELIAILNDKVDQPISLNPYYISSKDDSKSGIISYQMKDLPEGNYSLKVKVWNVCNNSSIGKTEFRVKSDVSVVLENVTVNPNPSSGNCMISINHNQVGQYLEASVFVYNLEGQQVATMQKRFIAESSVSENINFEGKDDQGNLLSNGLYIIQVKIINRDTLEESYGRTKLILER